MKEFRIFFGIVLAILLVMCFTYHSRLMPYLLLTVIIICVVSFAVALLARFGFSAEVIYYKPHEKIHRKDEVTFSVRIKNNFFLPLMPIQVYVNVLDKGIYLPQTKTVIASVPPFCEVTLTLKSFVSFRGEYHIGLEKAIFFDALKIHRFGTKCKAPLIITSYPRELDLYNLHDDNPDESETSRIKPHDFNKDAFSHLREYREGESLRHIHWKLSARLSDGDLIVKQMESNHDCSALIFCDFCGKFGNPEDTLEVSDTAIEISLAIIRKILQNRNSAQFIFQNKGIEDSESLEIKNLQSYGSLTESLVKLPAEPFEGEFPELLSEYGDELRLERSVYIITAVVTEKLVDKLRELGLTSKKNVVLTIIPSAVSRRSMVEYIETETEITILKL
jgi:uncharacterized protein (DUF58 family)